MEQKILELLTKAGCKPELVKAIGESLANYKTTIREQFEADYTAKVEQAKKLCIEETESHKREIARRLQIYLETKDAAITGHLERQAALRESEAVSKLRSVQSLLMGVQVEANGATTNGSATAIAEKANKTIKQLTEEKAQTVALLNKRNAIAEKVLKHNRDLTLENRRLKATLSGQRPVTEGQGPTTRIDSTRRAAQPVTSRPTLLENQDRRPAAPQPTGRVTGTGKGTGVHKIAEEMDEDLV